MFQEHTVEESIVKIQNRVWVKEWFPVLLELSRIINRYMLNVIDLIIILAHSS